MTPLEIARSRLHAQQIAGTACTTPAEVVARLGAVQAQDYAAAKWALGLRLPNATDGEVERACTEGAILRTHVLRPTWHFVAPSDIRWMLALTAPRVNAACAYYYRQFELDDALFARSNAALTAALQGGKQLTRAELAPVLQQAGIDTTNVQRLGHLVMRAELDGAICSGPRRGKQFTYALLDERVPPAAALPRDEALAALARRYFTSRGPATLKDYVWWSGLTAADARAGLELVRSQLAEETVDGQSYWLAGSPSLAAEPTATAYMLPNFDEFLVGYADRGAVFDTARTSDLGPRDSILFNHTIVVGGRVVGIWKRTLKKDAVVIATAAFSPFTDAEHLAVSAAAGRYGRFLGLPAVLS